MPTSPCHQGGCCHKASTRQAPSCRTALRRSARRQCARMCACARAKCGHEASGVNCGAGRRPRHDTSRSQSHFENGNTALLPMPRNLPDVPFPVPPCAHSGPSHGTHPIPQQFTHYLPQQMNWRKKTRLLLDVRRVCANCHGPDAIKHSLDREQGRTQG